MRQDVRATLRRPHVLVTASAILVLPSLTTYLQRDGTAFDHWLSYASNMFDWVALLFPLLVALLTQLPLLDEWSNTYALTTRSRVSPSVYLGAHVASSALVAGTVFGLMTVVSLVVARTTFTNTFGVQLAAPIETRYQFSELWATSPWLYLSTYVVWVAVVAATVGAWCTLLSAVISNKFVALVAPLVLWTSLNFALAVLQLEQFALPPFRFHIAQQAAWTELPGWTIGVIVTVGLWFFVRSRNYMTAGLVRA